MHNRYFKVDIATHYIVAVTVGQAPRPGIEFLEQTPETAHVGIGWSYVGGEFTDTREAYKRNLGAV
ncbi:MULTISPECIES: hypothetical protein [unclassified Ensifer]|uniref:hypothetical protein n=1 Tax=unclassified Ensifer TaxID=2633371 RepID=UPI000813A1F1|nr:MULTISPECIES: hypothetical protein [unclassified Ensifer]OCP07983.1 hypothetical protein BC362_10255 [Ensifer sp. LC14]OCP10907.1 hypothetical protein BC374_17710 [Ensifer sp. LC13]OCP11547.1 hypothetical protein BBX50_18145 [Ensifer sp. LC11]OCP33366.1 hypothetical protein BC364_17035 [Ensifer sp. LC499]